MSASENMTSAKQADVLPSFARHETFHPRYGWLKKGFDLASSDPELFQSEDATTRLGVGKNMVRAIRYWCLATKVLEERPHPEKSRVKIVAPTEFGSSLLSDDGWDPYLEDSGSLWLLQWQLLRPPCIAPSWYALFNHVKGSDLTDKEIALELQSFSERNPDWPEAAASSLLKDARCLLHMYASVRAGNDMVEDSIDSPFAELQLMRQVEGVRRHFTLNFGEKSSLPDHIVSYACADFVRTSQFNTRVVSLSALAGGLGSPGRAFVLPEDAIAVALDRRSKTSRSIELTHAAGSRQAVFAEDFKPESELISYFGAKSTVRLEAA